LVALLPAHEDATARIFEADDGEGGGWTHEGFARAIGWALGKRITTVSAPSPLLVAAAWADRIIRGKRAKLTPDRASYMRHPDWVIDRKAVPAAALWQPLIPTRDGLKATARWYKAQGWL
jgi:UDP-glucose 4-epimerase